MALSIINLPDNLKQLADARAAAIGYATVDEYVGALIEADAGEPISPELESHLLQALQTPAKEVSPSYWDAKRQQLSDLHQQGRL